MQDKRSLPTSEPPPYPMGSEPEKAKQNSQTNLTNQVSQPDNGGVQEPVNKGLPDIKSESVKAPSFPPSSPPSGQQKRGLPKKFIVLALFLGVLSVVAFLFLKFRSLPSTTLLGNEGEIVWWGIQHELSTYQPLIDEFEKENPNIKIKYERQSTTDYRVRLVSALLSGKGPDIFEIHNSWAPMFRNDLSTLPQSVMSKEEFAASFYPVVVSNLTLDKGVVGMPLEYDALTLFINEDVFASALKSPPEIWSEVQTISTELTQKDGGKIIQGGVALGITENVDHWQEIFAFMMLQNRVNPASPTGKPAADVFSFYKFFSGNKVWNNSLPSSTVAFSRGELAMYFGPTRRASEIIKSNSNLKFRTVKLPQLPKNNPTDPNYSYATYWFQGVSDKSKVKEGSWTFLKFLSREDSLRKLNENIKRAESIGRIYPRPAMNLDLVQDQIFGSVVSLAYDAKSWYLAGNTFDGEDGINTQVGTLFERVISAWPGGGQKELENTTKELSQVLGKYGIKTR